MILVFGPDDEEAFLAAQAALLERFEGWLAEAHPIADGDAEEIAGDAGIA